MSSDDADDERESPAPTPVTEWVDPKSLQFTLFVVLPNEEVCTLRNLTSGISVFDIKGRLELSAGVPCQLYTLVYPDGEELPDDQKLVVKENILHGYVLKMRLQEPWESLYQAVCKNNIEQVYHSGGVHLKGNIVISAGEMRQYESMVKERGGVALYMASYLGLQRMANMLLSVGVSTSAATYFGRTALHGAVAKDQIGVLQILVNNGAKLRCRDCFGASAMDVAMEMESCLCLRQLRLIQINIRGSAKDPTQTTLTGTSKKRYDHNSKRHNNSFERTHSTLSQYSETNSILKKKAYSHVSRKHISSSAPAKEVRIKPNANEETQSTLSAATSDKIRSKQSVKWKDVSAEYWQVIEIPRKVESSVNVKQVKYALPKTIFKFSEVNNQKLKEEKDKSRELSASATANPADRLTPEIRQAMRYSKQKLRHYKELAKTPDDYVPMSERQRKSYQIAPPEPSPSFRNWLARKKREEEGGEEDSSEESGEYFNQSDPEEDRMVAFNKRVRKMNRRNGGRSLTPGNRPVLDVMTFGSTVAGDASNPPAEENITAYKEWRSKRSENVYPKSNTSKDLMLQKRKLEEKRQKLLMNAISYDEWLDHTEERKFLIRQILKADFEEMKRLEEERKKDKQRMFSYDTWKEKLQKREQADKKRKRIQKLYDQERIREKLELDRTSFAVPFEEWLQKKNQSTPRQSNETKQVQSANVGHARLAESVH